jgi:hypothetical protein
MGGNFSITVKKNFGADCAETMSDINHFKKKNRVAGEEAT